MRALARYHAWTPAASSSPETDRFVRSYEALAPASAVEIARAGASCTVAAPPPTPGKGRR